MYKIGRQSKFDKDFKRCLKRGLNLEQLRTAIKYLEQTGTLPEKYKPHKLKGNYIHHWEAHIMPDWLIIWIAHDRINRQFQKIISSVRHIKHLCYSKTLIEVFNQGLFFFCGLKV